MRERSALLAKYGRMTAMRQQRPAPDEPVSFSFLPPDSFSQAGAAAYQSAQLCSGHDSCGNYNAALFLCYYTIYRGHTARKPVSFVDCVKFRTQDRPDIVYSIYILQTTSCIVSFLPLPVLFMICTTSENIKIQNSQIRLRIVQCF